MGIAGSVKLYDDMKNLQPKDGMMVKIEGTTFVAYTDTAGIYQFEEVPYGTYNLSYEKDGYGTYKQIGFIHSNDGDGKPAVVPAATLGKTSSTTVTDLSVKINADTIRLTSTISPAGTSDSARNVRYFFGADTTVSSSMYLGQSKAYEIKGQYGIWKMLQSDFITMGFTSGQTVYVKAYGDAEHSNEYINTGTGKLIFPNVNTTVFADTSFVLP